MSKLSVMLAAALVLVASVEAHAKDEWTDLWPGTRYLKRTTADLVHHVVVVGLFHRYASLRATKPGEKKQTTASFAKAVGAAVAVNGDWFNVPSYEPRGLAVGDGEHWPETTDVKDRSFIACDAKRRCEIDGQNAAKTLDKAWRNVVSGHGHLAIRGGRLLSAEEEAACGSFCIKRRRRTVVGLNRQKSLVFLLLGEGRRGHVAGPTLREAALVLQELGAKEAISLDSGAHSSLVINGKQVNRIPSNVPVANHLGVVYRPPKDGCRLDMRVRCTKFGCTCVDNKCNGGFCPGDGCTEAARSACRGLGCSCVGMQCSGGSCPGTGCTARMSIDCGKKKCGCVDGQCSGGQCPGSGCTRAQVKFCGRFGNPCADGKCSGGFAAGTGCTPRQIKDCERYGCRCVNGMCSGGNCPGTGCTAGMTINCKKKGCGCADAKCAGGKCGGCACTAKQIADCNQKGCGCADGKCAGGRCPGSACAGEPEMGCGLGIAALGAVCVLGLAVAIIVLLRRSSRRREKKS